MAINVTKPSVNLREKLNELETNKGLKGNEILQAETAQEVRSLIGAGRKNLIINGGFDVWQRGTSGTAVNGFNMSSADRWYSVRTQLNQETDTYGNPYAHCVCGNFTDTNYLQYKVEFPRKLLGKTLTLSYWIKSDDGLGQNGGLYIRYYTTGSGYETPVLESQKFGSEWTRVVRTFTMPTTAVYNDGYGLEIFIQGNNATANNNTKTFDIKEVQLELGSVATDFEHRSYGEELALCQRYYERFVADASQETLVCNGLSYTTTRTLANVFYLVEKRVKPTFSLNSSSDFQALTGSSGGWQTATGVSAVVGLRSARLDISGLSGLTASGACEIRLQTAANGAHWFAFDAEL